MGGCLSGGDSKSDSYTAPAVPGATSPASPAPTAVTTANARSHPAAPAAQAEATNGAGRAFDGQAPALSSAQPSGLVDGGKTELPASVMQAVTSASSITNTSARWGMSSTKRNSTDVGPSSTQDNAAFAGGMTPSMSSINEILRLNLAEVGMFEACFQDMQEGERRAVQRIACSNSWPLHVHSRMQLVAVLPGTTQVKLALQKLAGVSTTPSIALNEAAELLSKHLSVSLCR